MPAPATRLAHDLLGGKAVPGAELRLCPNVIRVLAMLTLAAARASFECGQSRVLTAFTQPLSLGLAILLIAACRLGLL
jgi:hypothetical protein